MLDVEELVASVVEVMGDGRKTKQREGERRGIMHPVHPFLPKHSVSHPELLNLQHLISLDQ